MEKSPTSHGEWWIAAALLGLFVVLGTVRVFDHPFPWYDDVAYLDLGNQIRELGGPAGLVRELYAGRFAEDNRQPIYVGLLSLVAGRDPGYHRRAQWLTLATGVLALLILWRVARRHVGPRAALVSLGLICVSETLIEGSAHESCEPLLVAFWALSVSALIRGDQHPRAWLAAGAWAGLAYLSKGSGIFLPILFVLTLLLERRRRALWSLSTLGPALGMGVTFALVASPVLVRNVRLYHHLFQQTNTRYFWIDRLPDFAESFAPHALERLPNGAREYLAQTSLGAVAARIFMGVGETLIHLGDAMSFVAPRPFGAIHIAWIVVGLFSSVVALRLLWRSPRGFTRTFLLAQSIWFYCFFAFFNAIGGASRYLFPMTITWVVVLSRALVVSFEDGASALARSWPRRVWGLALVAVTTALALDARPHVSPPGQSEIRDWLVSHLRPGDVYAVDARSLLQPRWLLPSGIRQEIVSASWREQAVAPGELLAWMRSKQVRYVVIDSSSRATAVGTPRYFFYDRLPLAADGSLPRQPLPEGTHLVYRDGDAPGTPCRWMVLALDP